MDLLIAECGPTLLDEEGKCVGWMSEPLSPAGVVQTQALVAALPKVSHIFYSHLKQAAEMAHAAAKRFGLPEEQEKGRFIPDAKLWARRFGRLQGKTWEEVHAAVGTDFDKTVPQGGESDVMFQGRITEFFTNLAKMRVEEGQCIFLVTHGDVIAFVRKMYPALTLLFGSEEARETAKATLYQFSI